MAHLIPPFFPRLFASLRQSPSLRFQPERDSQIAEHPGMRVRNYYQPVLGPPDTNCKRSRFGVPRSRIRRSGSIFHFSVLIQCAHPDRIPRKFEMRRPETFRRTSKGREDSSASERKCLLNGETFH